MTTQSSMPLVTQRLRERNRKALEAMIAAEEEANKTDINDQSKYLADQKVEVLRSIN